MSAEREWTWTGDKAEDEFRLRAFMDFGFDVDTYDEWLRALPPCPARDEHARIRAEAKAEWLHGKSAKRLMHHLWASRQAIERDEEQRPLAEKGKLFAGGRKPGAGDEVTRYIRGARRPGETARALWERLKALGASDEQPVYFDRVGDEMIARRNDKAISFEAFEKRLSRGKRR